MKLDWTYYCIISSMLHKRMKIGPLFKSTFMGIFKPHHLSNLCISRPMVQRIDSILGATEDLISYHDSIPLHTYLMMATIKLNFKYSIFGLWKPTQSTAYTMAKDLRFVRFSKYHELINEENTMYICPNRITQYYENAWLRQIRISYEIWFLHFKYFIHKEGEAMVHEYNGKGKKLSNAMIKTNSEKCEKQRTAMLESQFCCWTIVWTALVRRNKKLQQKLLLLSMKKQCY